MSSVLTKPKTARERKRGRNYYWFTAEDLEMLPPDWRVELVKGRLRKMPPPPGEAHGSTTNRFGAYATSYALEHGLGECYAAETGFVIERNPDSTRGPDFAFVSRERLPGALQPRNLRLVPDLVLETRSPSQSRTYVDDKIAHWLDSGTRMALVLDPAKRTLTVFRVDRDNLHLGVGDVFDGEDVLPGFRLPIRKLFRDLDGKDV